MNIIEDVLVYSEENCIRKNARPTTVPIRSFYCDEYELRWPNQYLRRPRPNLGPPLSSPRITAQTQVHLGFFSSS